MAETAVAAAQQAGPTAPKLKVITDVELEQAAAQWLHDNLFLPAKQYREAVANDSQWPEYRERFNATYDVPLDDDEAENFHANIYLSTIDTVKGIALQTPSAVEFAPVEPDDEQFAAELTAVIGEYLWSARKARFKLGVGFLEGAILGTAWSKTFWDPELMGNQGDADFTVLTADEVWVDPGCTGVNDWKYIIHAPRRPLLEVKYNGYLYNDRRSEVTADSAVNEGQKRDTAEQQVDTVTPFEYWVKGVYLRAFATEVPGIESYIDADAWKFGLQIVVANPKLVLKIETHPFKSDRFPFQRFVYYQPTGMQRIWGTGEIHNLKDIGDGIDARMSQMLQHAALIANQQWIISSIISADKTQFTNKAGALIEVDGPPDAVRRIEPSGISGSLFGITNLLLELRQMIPGMYDVNTGDTPGSLRAGVAIEALQRGGNGRTAQKMANFDEWVADIGMGLADVMAAMYSDERVFRITGAAAQDIALMQQQQTEANAPKKGFIQRGIDAVKGAMGANGAPMQQTPDQQEPVASATVKLSKESFKRGDKQILLDARAQTTILIRDQLEKLRFDIELLEGGVVDAQYVIEENPAIKNRERLLARLQATQQNAQAAAGGVPQEAPPEQDLPSGTDSNVSDDDAEQISMVIEQTIAQLEELEAQGVVQPGFAQQAQQLIAAEIQQGGTGEQALMQIMEAVQAAAQEQQAGMMPSPTGVA